MENKKTLTPDDLKFDKNGLIPAVIVDYNTKRVLTLAYMNRESLNVSLEKKLTCFWSRSRQELWLKGAVSGNYQHIVSITADCDRDALEVEVVPDGPACHKGTYSCFEAPLYISEKVPDAPACANADAGGEAGEFSLKALAELIKTRKTEKTEGSYTSYLFEKGIDKILKKVGEECTEVIIAAKAGDRAETVYEISDLVYHVLVLMAETGIETEDIINELASRRIIDKKIKQEKMTGV